MTRRFRATCESDLLLARLLAVLRRRRGLTQATLAEKLGVSAPTVAAWEQGRTAVTVGMLDEIGSALDIPGLLIHGLHAQTVVDLDHDGCPVGAPSWRRPRGRNVKPPVPASPTAEVLVLAPSQVDSWLDDWMDSAALPQAALRLDADRIVHTDIPWRPTALTQRLSRCDRPSSPDERGFRIVEFELGGGPAEPPGSCQPLDERGSHSAGICVADEHAG
jgi:DNA-binding XRE family transcriptional regulator